ncbi:MAG: IPT/TIG domain-containing protein [Prevotellaceae bacterium]|jgi:hypothetical protein|nr:IPT/TIG domain-containing protein [Prevotellaceae bacterium]
MENTNIMKLGAVVLLLLLGLAQCKDEDSFAQHDPGTPVEVTAFTPDSGSAAAQLLIYGSNFGTDTSLIEVTINGTKAPVLGSNGSVIFAMVPRKAAATDRFCNVKLRVGTQEVLLKEQFYYKRRYMVTTLAGTSDRDGQRYYIDGPIDMAQFRNPCWLMFDDKYNLFIIDEGDGVRYINAAQTEVKTLFRTGNGVSRPRSIAFTSTYDTMIVSNDQPDQSGYSQVMVKRNADGSWPENAPWTPVCYTVNCNGGAFHPVNNNEYYFNSYTNGEVYKVNDTKAARWTPEELFRTGDVNWEFGTYFAPSGNFAYFVVVNNHYIARSTYDWGNHKLLSPIDFVGVRGENNRVDGALTNARVTRPFQGTFDEDDNFYFCEQWSHTVRKITPEGIVTTFAGRSFSLGFVDGELREAVFNGPGGIAYDKRDGTFYVGDVGNGRIRKIAIE